MKPGYGGGGKGAGGRGEEGERLTSRLSNHCRRSTTPQSRSDFSPRSPPSRQQRQRKLLFIFMPGSSPRSRHSLTRWVAKCLTRPSPGDSAQASGNVEDLQEQWAATEPRPGATQKRVKCGVCQFGQAR